MSEQIGDGYIEIEGRPDRSQIRKAAEESGDESGRHFGKQFTSAATSALRAALGIALKGVVMGAMGVAVTGLAAGAASLAIQLLGVIPALVSISSLVSLLPGALLGTVAAATILQVAMQGVGDAIGAAFGTDVEKFKEAIKNLSPSAQLFVKSIRDMVPALKNVQKGIQEAFFSAGLINTIKQIDDALIPLRGNLNLIASLFGGFASNIVSFTTQAKTLTVINGILYALSVTVAVLRANFSLLAVGFRDVIATTLPMLTTLGVSIGSLVGQFGMWMSNISSSGQLKDWIDQAVVVLGTLWQILKNVFSIFSSVLYVAEATGGGALNTFAQLTTQLATFLDSAQGITMLTSVFNAITAVSNALMPIITTIAGVVLTTLAPAIEQLALVLGPVLLTAVNLLAPAIQPLITAFVALVSAFAPFIPAIALLASQLSGALAGAITQFLPALLSIIQPLISLSGPIIGLLINVLMTLLTTLMPIISTLITGLAPIILVIVNAFGQWLVAITPVLNLLSNAFVSTLEMLLPIILQLVTSVISALLPAFMSLIPAVIQIYSAFLPLIPLLAQMLLSYAPLIVLIVQLAATIMTQLMPAMLPLILTVVNLAVTLTTTLLPAFMPLIPVIMQLIVTISSLLIPIIIPLITLLAKIASVILGALGGALTWLISNVLQLVVGALSSFINKVIETISAISNFASRIFSAFSSAKDTIVNVFSNAGSLLLDAGRNVVNGLIHGITSQLGALRSKANEMASMIKNVLPFSPAKTGPLSGRGNPFYSGQSIMKLITDGMDSQVGAFSRSVVAAVQPLTPTALTQNVLTPTSSTNMTLPTPQTTANSTNSSANRSSRGGNTYNLTVNALDPRSAAASVMDAIDAWERGNGSGWRMS